MTIQVPPDLAEALTAAASRQGTTPEQMALETLTRFYLPIDLPELQEGGSLYDLIKDHIGTVSGSGENLAEDCGGHFIAGVVEKQRQGKL